MSTGGVAVVSLVDIAQKLKELSNANKDNNYILNPKLLLENKIDQLRKIIIVLSEVEETEEALKNLAIAYKLKKQFSLDLAVVGDVDKDLKAQLQKLQKRNNTLEKELKKLKEKGKVLDEENVDLKEQIEILNKFRDAETEKKQKVDSESDSDENTPSTTYNANVAEEEEGLSARTKNEATGRGRSHSKVTVRVEKASSASNNNSISQSTGPKKPSTKDETGRMSFEQPTRRETSVKKSKDKKEDKKKKEYDNKAHPDIFDKNTIQDIIDGLKMTVQESQFYKEGAELDIEEYKENHQILIRRPGQELLKFKHFAPKVFASVRAMFGVSSEYYLRSFQIENVKAVKGEGKSGAYFIFTKDRQFVLKTTTGEERDYLWDTLPYYYQYIKRHPHSLLPKFYGVYSMKHDGIGGVTRFVIMNNIFNTPFELLEKYDLKGSTVGRYVSPKNRVKGAILKDLDIKELNRKIYLEKPIRKEFLKQLKKDCDFLSLNKVMDYSLLFGIYYETPENKDKTQDDLKNYLENPNIIPNLTQTKFQQYYGGIKAVRPDGVTEVYFVGIIDVLIQYATRKRLEHMFKSITSDPEEVSVVPPPLYSERFYKFIDSLVYRTPKEEKEKKKDSDSSSVNS